jgi:predicted phage tail protein
MAKSTRPRRTPALPPPISGTTRIVLHGRLRRQFGHHVDWGCPTPANAIYALCTNYRGFREELAKGQYRVVRGPLKGGLDLGIEMMGIRFSDKVREMHIIPVAAGAAKGNTMAVIKIVLGVALLAVGGLVAGGVIGTAAIAGGGALANTLFGVSAGAIILTGAGMVATGVGDILTHQPKPPAPNASFLLQGPTNTTSQGGPVPLPYGFKVRVGSVVIASAYEAVALGNGVGANQKTGTSGNNP